MKISKYILVVFVICMLFTCKKNSLNPSNLTNNDTFLYHSEKRLDSLRKVFLILKIEDETGLAIADTKVKIVQQAHSSLFYHKHDSLKLYTLNPSFAYDNYQNLWDSLTQISLTDSIFSVQLNGITKKKIYDIGTICLSHPNILSINFLNISDSLILDTWRIEKTLKNNRLGEIQLDIFKGEYDITVEKENMQKTFLNYSFQADSNASILVFNNTLKP